MGRVLAGDMWGKWRKAEQKHRWNLTPVHRWAIMKMPDLWTYIL